VALMAIMEALQMSEGKGRRADTSGVDVAAIAFVVVNRIHIRLCTV
jgi:hypothetical protein